MIDCRLDAVRVVLECGLSQEPVFHAGESDQAIDGPADVFIVAVIIVKSEPSNVGHIVGRRVGDSKGARRLVRLAIDKRNI